MAQTEQSTHDIVAEPAFETYVVAIGSYQYMPAIEGMEAEVAQITDELAQFGGATRQILGVQNGLGTSDLHRAMADWTSYQAQANSVIVWIGHGEARGNEAWLATSETREPMRGTAISPHALAEHLVAQWQRRQLHDEESWTIVLIEACGAQTFVRHVAQVLLDQESTKVPQRLAIIGVGAEGINRLGGLSKALAATRQSYTENDREIQIRDLVGRLESYLDDGHVYPLGMHQSKPLPGLRPLTPEITAPVDVYAELRDFIDGLSVDERSHFIPKAQSAEQGEFAWYFVGRSSERRRISEWLAAQQSGMLVVTGRAGSGKSALLGNVVVHANPPLLALLKDMPFFDEAAEEERPPPNAFHAVVHLTGLTTSDLIKRIAQQAGLDHPGGAASDVDWLLESIRDRPFTLLVDALDEAQAPHSVASSILRRIAALPQGRVIVGTRRSTVEGPDHEETSAEDILDALGRHAATVLPVERDREAVASYVDRRLKAARDKQALGATDAAIANAVELIAGHNRQFLYARLAVHEILARPDLLSQETHDELTQLLARDHRVLFGNAVRRLSLVSAINAHLLRALALARGRGLPRADRIWAKIAEAISAAAVAEEDIDALLIAGAPYIMLDAEAGQSVYRLAHRTFTEYFDSQGLGTKPSANGGTG